jgi:DNA replication protein DnaC
MDDDTTYCVECFAPIAQRTNPEGYKQDLCPTHFKLRPRPAVPNGALDAYWTQREREFLSQGPLDRLREWGVPLRTARAAVTHYIQTPAAFEATRKGILNGDSVYLYGPSGTGKSVLAAALLYHYAHMAAAGKVATEYMYGDTYRFVSVPELLATLRRSFTARYANVATEDESTIVDHLKGSVVLVLDDLGAEKTSDWTLSTLYTIINYRYEFFRPTLFTSNLSLAQLSERMEDDRIPNRVAGWCTTLQLNERTFR